MDKVWRKPKERRLHIVDLPSVSVTQILSFLSWEDKLNIAEALPFWKDSLETVGAWCTVNYGKEMEENIYFIKDKRIRFATCIVEYGKWFKSVKVVFGYRVGHVGLKILHAISEFCSKMQVFYICQEQRETGSLDLCFWNSNFISLVSAVLRKHQQLKFCYLVQPTIDWSDVPEKNIMVTFTETELASRITHLELSSVSFFNHVGYLKLLTKFDKLRCLVVSREKVDNRIIMQLVDHCLQELTLVQEEEVSLEQGDFKDNFWTEVRAKQPSFKLDLVLRCVIVIKEIFSPKMPLRSLVMDDLVNIITKGVMDHIAACYKDTLEKFTYTNFLLENGEAGDRRLPFSLVSLTRYCTKLKCLVHGFPLSSTTALLIAKSRKLRKFILSAVEIAYEFDWPEEQFTPEEVAWLKKAGSSEASLEKEVSSLLGYRWRLYNAEDRIPEDYYSERILQ